MGWFITLATSDNKLFVESLSLHEIRKELTLDHTGVFERVGDVIMGDHKKTTARRL